MDASRIDEYHHALWIHAFVSDPIVSVDVSLKKRIAVRASKGNYESVTHYSAPMLKIDQNVPRNIRAVKMIEIIPVVPSKP